MLGSTDAPAEPKRARHADGGGGDAGDDRLSALPDDLLRTILSRLMAQQTVQTCMLSTRWRHLWRAVKHQLIHLRWIEHDVKHQLGILGALSNVTTLHLLHFAVTLLFNESHENPPLFKFENLTTLFLDECRISNDFLGLQQYLENSCNLQKLTLRHCKVLDFHPTNEVMERCQSYSKDLPHFRCKNLRLCEIIYRDGDASVHLLVKFFVGMWRNLPNNKIELTPVKEEKQKSGRTQ
ncbi:hypothetical protein CFC21_053930 [Triticum aestivum]|uniref:F-box domain-containing protein n=2 Tax=Triticum aestivum TaxID=4565 RepID=A0A9R1K8F5_WHEAT|nr:putative F-box/LRR-repeat protein At5g02930 [Triticum aestivum]KAF7044735.1 hypothetical protein CFC21_053925 [Triticum aestivum]KAF7044741.1 hypothetical protein CFC21_053930 [Triticum aestivum]